MVSAGGGDLRMVDAGVTFLTVDARAGKCRGGEYSGGNCHLCTIRALRTTTATPRRLLCRPSSVV